MRSALVLVVTLLTLAIPQVALSQDSPDGTETEEGSSSSITCGGSKLPPTTATTATAEACSDYSLGQCKTVWAGRSRHSTAGVLVWRYRQEIYFCWSSNKITYLSRTRWGKTYLPCCWDYQGHIGNSTTWNAKWSYRAFTEGKFKWYGPPWDMFKTPSIWMTVYGNGTWTHRTES